MRQTIINTSGPLSSIKESIPPNHFPSVAVWLPKSKVWSISCVVLTDEEMKQRTGDREEQQQ